MAWPVGWVVVRFVMPNLYKLEATAGALALRRHWVPGPGEKTRPPLGGGGTRAGLPGRSTAGRVQTTWSKRSRRTMRYQFGALPWDLLGQRPVMVTFTYPGEWRLYVMNSQELHKHREALKERWRRRYGMPVGVWVTEFQKRGAPHLHMYLGLPDAVSDEEYRGLQLRTMQRRRAEHDVGKHEARRRLGPPEGEFSEWLRTAWFEIVGSGLEAHQKRGVDIAAAFYSEQAESMANRARVAEYFWRESGKWAQKQPPVDFGGLSFYGRWGQKLGFKPVISETDLGELAALELRRVLRRMQKGRLQEEAKRTGWKVPRDAGGSRGRDGLTVFGVDGRSLAPRLKEWAEDLAATKAAERAAAGEVPYPRWRRELVRALPELEVDESDWPDPADLIDEDDMIPDWVLHERMVEEHFAELETRDERDEEAFEAARARREFDQWRRARIAEIAEQARSGSRGERRRRPVDAEQLPRDP